MLVSFIIPAYNAADTIVRCLDSIYRLSLKRDEFEVIVVDDASTDNTVSVIENWKLENEDCELEILRQPENQRQGAARNRGVCVANGEYICFVDADDAVTEGIVKAIRMAKEKQIDMTAFHYVYVNYQDLITREADKLYSEEGKMFSGIEMQNHHPYWCAGPVAYVYNRAFLERVNYPFVEGVLFEDSDFVAVHLYHAKRITYSAELGYKAFFRENSTIRSLTYKSAADYLLLGVRMLQFYEYIMEDKIKVNENEGIKKFADGILEGACWNINKSCRRIIKLNTLQDVNMFYKRVDSMMNRRQLCENKQLQKYYWSMWTYICLSWRSICKLCYIVVSPIYKLLKND